MAHHCSTAHSGVGLISCWDASQTIQSSLQISSTKMSHHQWPGHFPQTRQLSYPSCVQSLHSSLQRSSWHLYATMSHLKSIFDCLDTSLPSTFDRPFVSNSSSGTHFSVFYHPLPNFGHCLQIDLYSQVLGCFSASCLTLSRLCLPHLSQCHPCLGYSNFWSKSTFAAYSTTATLLSWHHSIVSPRHYYCY